MVSAAPPAEHGLYAYSITLTGTSFSGAVLGTTKVTATAPGASPILFGDGTATGAAGSKVTVSGVVNTPFGSFNYSEPGQYIGTATDSTGKFIGFIGYSPALDPYVGSDYVLLTTAPLSGTTGTLHISSGSADTTKSDNWDLSKATDVCFAAGTSISTPSGGRPVETLQAGDIVTTLTGDKPVIWTGTRKVDLSKIADPDRHRLVRIRRGAFAPAMPKRDLLVTQEHCIFVAGKLIPARMLVNERSIIIDRSIDVFGYHHVELAEHSILYAEGLTTESYLDTGNRSRFANGHVVALRPAAGLDAAHKNWQTHAAAPFAVTRELVEPVWQALNKRAVKCRKGANAAAIALTTDADFQIVTDSGQTIRPAATTGGRMVFVIPAGTTRLRLVSRTFRPSETMGPFIDDRRDLGVEVGKITAWHGRRNQPVTQHLDAADLPGWFGLQAGASRWTNGNALLQLPASTTAMLLEIEITSAGPYKMPVVDTLPVKAAA